MTGGLTGRGVLVWLFGFFGIVFAMNTYFIVASSRTFRGEDEQKPYLQGMEYNQTLARHAQQAALGWTTVITAARLPSGDVRIEVRMRDRAGRPLTDSRLAGELRHPSDANRDRALPLTEHETGTYLAQLSHVSPGVWDVLVHSNNKLMPFDAERRLWVR